MTPQALIPPELRKISMREVTDDVDEAGSQSDADPPILVGEASLGVEPHGLRGEEVRISHDSTPPRTKPDDAEASGKRKRGDLSTTEKSAKKVKEKKKSKHRVHVKDVIMDDAFLKKNYAEWCKDPIYACAQVMMNVAEVHKIKREEYEKQAQGMLDVEKQRHFQTLQELIAKSESLKKARFDLECARTGKKYAETARDAALIRARDAESKVKQLEESLKELEISEATARKSVQSLEKQLAELKERSKVFAEGVNGGSSDPDARITALQARLAKTQGALKASQAEAKGAASLALEMYSDGYNEALAGSTGLSQPPY